MDAAQKRAIKRAARIVLGMLPRNGSAHALALEDSAPRRILLLNGAHIGDVVISTSILPVLRSAFPNAEIGYVLGSWSKMVLADHPDVNHLHVVDHWFLNRATIPLHSKLSQYRRTRSQALKDIKSLGYDLSLCLHPFYSDLLRLSSDAGIPLRAAFDESIFSAHAHITSVYPDNLFITQGDCLSELIRALGIDPAYLKKRKATLAPDTEQSRNEVCNLLQVSDLAQSRHSVIHVGSGAPARELSPHVWREVASKLSKDHTVILTGKGPRDEANIKIITDGLSNCIDAAGKLSWRGFVTAVRHADVLYGVESMAGHVAAAVETRSVLVYAGTAGPARWRPESKLSTIWTNHVRCAPCGLIQGCEEMSCIRGITAEDILNPLGPVY